jgi:Family of unknown function (DUF5706)
MAGHDFPVEQPLAAAPATSIDFTNHREILEVNVSRQIEAIRSADIKIALLVPTTTAMLGVLAAMLREQPGNPLHLVSAGLCSLPLFAAFGLMAIGVFPRLRRTGKRSLLFFGDIAAREPAEAESALMSLAPAAYLADLAAQCHANACIARTKHQCVRRAYFAFLLALPFWLVTIWLLNSN